MMSRWSSTSSPPASEPSVSQSTGPVTNARDLMKGAASYMRGAVIGASRVESHAAKIRSIRDLSSGVGRLAGHGFHSGQHIIDLPLTGSDRGHAIDRFK